MICLVRHGEAEAGWGHAADPGLSTLGGQQAEAVGEQLARQPFEQAFSSPMARCQQTSRPFARRSGLTIATEPKVSEIPTPEGLDDRVAWLRGFMAGTWDEALPLLHDWRKALIERVEALPDNTVVFTHFIAINSIVGHLSGSQLVTSFRPGHCSVTRLNKGADGLSVSELGSEAATQVI